MVFSTHGRVSRVFIGSPPLLQAPFHVVTLAGISAESHSSWPAWVQAAVMTTHLQVYDWKFKSRDPRDHGSHCQSWLGCQVLNLGLLLLSIPIPTSFLAAIWFCITSEGFSILPFGHETSNKYSLVG